MKKMQYYNLSLLVNGSRSPEYIVVTMAPIESSTDYVDSNGTNGTESMPQRDWIEAEYSKVTA